MDQSCSRKQWNVCKDLQVIYSISSININEIEFLNIQASNTNKWTKLRATLLWSALYKSAEKRISVCCQVVQRLYIFNLPYLVIAGWCQQNLVSLSWAVNHWKLRDASLPPDHQAAWPQMPGRLLLSESDQNPLPSAPKLGRLSSFVPT